METEWRNVVDAPLTKDADSRTWPTKTTMVSSRREAVTEAAGKVLILDMQLPGSSIRARRLL